MHILIFGDSIAQGFHDNEKGGWVNRLFTLCVSKMLESQYDRYEAVFNLGISGERSCDLRKRFDNEFETRLDSEIVTMFAIGMNDSARNMETGENWCSLSEYERNMVQMVSKAKTHGQVVLVGLTGIDEQRVAPIPWFTEYGHYQSDRDKYDDVLRKLSEETEAVYIGTEDIFLENKSRLLQDGLHPNAEGHRLIFERVKDVLEKENLL